MIRIPFSSFCLMPGFLVIGAQKAGTSSLFNYLKQHPYISPPIMNKELHYFDLHYKRGDRWYRAQFPFNHTNKVSGEKSPYYLFHPLSPERAYEFNKNFRILVLLRDPVKRAYSHYNHEIENGREYRPFRVAVEQEINNVKKDHKKIMNSDINYSFTHQRYSYFMRGLYEEQLNLWLSYFPKESIYIQRSEKFFEEPQTVCSEIFQFLDLPDYKPNTKTRYNPGKYNPMKESDKFWLANLYKNPNIRLAKKYGVDISDWE